MLESINQFLGTVLVPILLSGIGFYFLFKVRFFYVLHPIATVKTIFTHCASSETSLWMALAGTLGIGNIVGVSSAILLGGAGAIFWIWVSAFLSMSVKYVEVVFTIRYRKRENGVYYGGVPYYVKELLAKKIGKTGALVLSYVFAFLCIVNSLTTGNLVQVNTVCNLLDKSSLPFGLILALCVFLVICGGERRIGNFTSVLIPILSILYLLASFFIIGANLSKVPSVFLFILQDAFSVKSALCGFCSYGIISSVRYGYVRGLLSSESGCGTSTIAHASTRTTDAHAQGCFGILEVFIDIFVFCTVTAFAVLLSGQVGFDETETISRTYVRFGSLVSVLTFLFGFGTICMQYFYGMKTLHYFSEKKRFVVLYTVVFLGVVVLGSVLSMEIMWQISDFVISLLCLLHLLCLFAMRNDL